MKKTSFMVIATLVLFACTEQNAPSNSSAKNGALPGKFSVGPSTQVVFSQGNLQYQASSNTWRFAANQYEVIGADNKNISPSYDGWIDLFGWGTGNNPTLSSTNDADYTTFIDWGTNAINNGGNKVGIWRTLSYEEWDYILNKRINAARFQGSVTVCGVYGYAILPDDWIMPSSISFVPDPQDWSTNVYSLDSWNIMESAGAIFLPAAGRRYGTQIEGIRYLGLYASSSDNGYFDYESAWGYMNDWDGQGAYGFSVRLVKDIK